ncbi:MAG: hypothetical protein R6U63_07215 [Longimicrobiales bacterium]
MSVPRPGRTVRPLRATALSVLALLALVAPALLGPAPAAAQGVRGSAATTFRYLTLRPIGQDTVDRASVTESDGVLTLDGQPVHCISATECLVYRPRDVAHAMVATQDISGTAWGLGVQGLSATFLLRGRADAGGDVVWPMADDAFDAILAYAQLQRSSYRLRAGRQRTLSGLGFSGFDGLDLLVEPFPGLRLQAYGGRSLARGLNEPSHTALQGVEDFVLDQNAYLVGGFAEIAPLAATTVAFRYQREIWADRIGLVSERAAVDVRSALPGPFRMDGSLDYDVAFGRIGKAHLTVQSRLPGDWGWVEVTGRRYVPYFDLSTIWGFFSPTPYQETELRTTVLKLRPLTAWASAAYRWYSDPEISVIGSPIGDASQRYTVGARWASGAWQATGEYRLETGFGAHLSSGDAQLRWSRGDRFGVRVRGTAFQQIEQFRVGENTVMGGGLGFDVTGPWGVNLRAGADLYTQAFENRTGPDWDQFRAYSVLRVPFGEDPGPRGQP